VTLYLRWSQSRTLTIGITSRPLAIYDSRVGAVVLAAAAAEEEGSEKVRLECLEGLIGLASNLSMVVKELTPPIRRTSFQTEKPGDSKAVDSEGSLTPFVRRLRLHQKTQGSPSATTSEPY